MSLSDQFVHSATRVPILARLRTGTIPNRHSGESRNDDNLFRGSKEYEELSETG